MSNDVVRDAVISASSYALVFAGVYRAVYGAERLDEDRASVVESCIRGWAKVRGGANTSEGDVVRQFLREGKRGTSSNIGEVDVGSDGHTGGACKCGSDSGVGRSGVSGDDGQGEVLSVSDEVADERGPNWERNRAWKAEKKRKRDAKKHDRVPAWRVGAKPLSPPSTVVTVDSRTAEEIEAARTLAVRRTFENRLAVVKTKHQLASYADKDKTEAIKRLEVARIEERINTTKAKSQASYKKCDTPLNSVGSAGSAGEFAWKQEIRKRDAVIKERDYYEQQLEVAMKFLPDAGKRAIAELPEPYIPTLEDIEFEDADISPYYSREEMEAEAAKWVGDEAW